MDASASPDPDSVIVYGFIIKGDDNSKYPPLQQNNTVIKYTKLPDFDIGTKVSQPPRLRHIIEIDDDGIKSSRSNRSKVAAVKNESNRKFVTIAENDRYVPIKERTTSLVRTSNRTIRPDLKTTKSLDNKSSVRIIKPSKSSKYSARKIETIPETDERGQSPRFFINKDNSDMPSTVINMEANLKQSPPSNKTKSRYMDTSKPGAKTNSAYNKREVNTSQSNFYRGKQSSNKLADTAKTRQGKEKVSLRNSKSANTTRTSVSNYVIKPNESEQEITKLRNILYVNFKTNCNNKQKPVKKPQNQTPVLPNKRKASFKELAARNRPTVIKVPNEDKYFRPRLRKSTSPEKLPVEETVVKTVVNETNINTLKDVNVGTVRNSVDQVTDMDDFRIDTVNKCEGTVQTESIKEVFDSLEIPNVTLTKEKSEQREEMDNAVSSSILNLNAPPFKITPYKEEISSSDLSFCQSTSYVYSHSTVTYTTRKKINFHVVGNDSDVRPKMEPSPLDYPINVMAVFKNELKNKLEHVSSDDECKKKNNTREEYVNCINELKSLNCSYVFNKLMKPSNIISSIQINNGLLQNDYICEQFQRELNFIDSFFDSLQYLESCSLTDKCITDTKVESLVKDSVLFDSTFDIKNLEYDNFLSRLENGANVDDTETIASKSLCLLNLLIRDEQRRAKNLLFVLKMREDALKDFTKSQILWLEKKKKHDNTDISTLKKKQRGALVKLQHECGEMQRMRKALVTLSEKRKLALMKTKKNIELKLKNNVDVEQIILGKKKLKRTPSGERNASPLKCFDLSSSGCEDSSNSKLNADLPPAELCTILKVTSAEKYVQTGEPMNFSLKQDDSDITAENFIAVDGSYLNILFHDLALPQIFSGGKQYEVNEEELKNIVTSTANKCTLNSSEVVATLMDQVKNRDLDTSSPSTARSLVDEFDQYYRVLAEDDKYPLNTPDLNRDSSSAVKIVEMKESNIQVETTELDKLYSNIETMTSNSEEMCDLVLLEVPKSCLCESNVSEGTECYTDIEAVTYTSHETGPLTVPVGENATESPPPDVPTFIPPKSSGSSGSDTDSISSQPQDASSTTTMSHPIPSQSEAEELRRQQLAIEREIKALEQQQCRMLVVREIPDKPPPPYTPPTEVKPKPQCMFTIDEGCENKIEKIITCSLMSKKSTVDNKDLFDLFLNDFCQESIERHEQDLSDKPWDATNLLPQKPQVDTQKLIQNTSMEVKEVLSNVAPVASSAVSNRRSDHIDEILFSEWRRCEPEWTALHTDEVAVKNQLFESIFQKILTETIDEYKKTVSPNECQE